MKPTSVVVLLFVSGGSIAQKLLRGGQSLAMMEIVKGLTGGVGRGKASEGLHVIGESFKVQPEIINCDDPMSALAAIVFRSWASGSGALAGVPGVPTGSSTNCSMGAAPRMAPCPNRKNGARVPYRFPPSDTAYFKSSMQRLIPLL